MSRVSPNFLVKLHFEETFCTFLAKKSFGGGGGYLYLKDVQVEEGYTLSSPPTCPHTLPQNNIWSVSYIFSSYLTNSSLKNTSKCKCAMISRYFKCFSQILLHYSEEISNSKIQLEITSIFTELIKTLLIYSNIFKRNCFSFFSI